MKISLITPTHNPKYLCQLYESVCAQTYEYWEWIIVHNGPKLNLMGLLPVHEKIHHVNLPEELESKGIGAIKAWSFAQGNGDILLEMDHDDLLAPNALERVAAEFERTGADFVYSNFCEFFGDSPAENRFHFYPNWERNGWRYRTHDSIASGPISETVGFSPRAASLGTIYYAPNHLRAWTKDFYHRIGGHNPDFRICDDHELLIRTYLKGTMHHIDECLYFYRMGENNTYKDCLDEIRNTTYRLYTENIETLILREGELTAGLCYDLGGGFNSPEGWKSVDIAGAEICCDLRKQWPWADSSVLAFRAHDLIEHLPDKQHTMRELHRCLKPGGYALISVPSALGQGAFQDPTHCSYWVENSFRYYTEPEFAKYIRNDTEHFICDRLFTWAPQGIPYVKAELRAIKGDMTGVPGFRLFV